jgi:hypothetical protein
MQNGSEHYSLRPYFTQIVYKVVDFSEDTSNVKLGKNHLVSTLLKELMPNLLIVPCSCLSAHLCVDALQKFLPAFRLNFFL